MSPSPSDPPLPSRRSLRAAAEQAESERVAAAALAAAEPAVVAPTATESVGAEPLVADDADPSPDVSTRERRRARLAADTPRQKTGHTKAWVWLTVFAVLLALLGAAAFALRGPVSQLVASVQGPQDYTSADSADGTDTVVMIHDGDTGAEIARTLVEEGVVKSFDAFYSVLLGASPEPVFQPGAYQLATKMTGSAALAALQDPTTKLEQTVVIPEGTPAADVLELLTEGTDLPLAELQAAAADVGAYGLPAEASTVEGFLFPATYTFRPDVTASDVIATLVDRQFEALDQAGVAPENRWSTIVLASLIQREAGLRDDFFKVSRVFLNRTIPALWPSGLLQSDATVAYGTGNTHRVSTTDAERADAANPYNTYVHPGMVVGPISNPGDLAIDAALHPADGGWLYFVTTNLDTGETAFATTIEEHQANVNVWLNWMAEHPEYE